MNVPDKLISQCSWEEICIYIFIKKRKENPSVRKIADEFSLPKSSIQRKLKHLQDLGYIEKKTQTVFGTAVGAETGTPSGTPNTLTDNDSDMVLGTAVGAETGTPSGTPKASSIDERKKAFEYSLAPYVTSGQYDAKMVRAFSDYWTEFNKSRTKMRWELEKTWETNLRLSNWARRNGEFKSKPTNMDVGIILHDSKNKDYGKGTW